MVNFSPFGITLPTNVFCKIRAQFSSIMQNSLQPSSVGHLNSFPKFTCDFCNVVRMFRNSLFFFIRFPNMRDIFRHNHPQSSSLLIFYMCILSYFSTFCNRFYSVRQNSTKIKQKKHSYSSLSARMLSL